MNEDKLFQLLNSLDDDLVENEVEKILQVEIDMDAIKKKAHEKLHKYSKKDKKRKRSVYAAVACLCLLSVTTIYANDISQAISAFFNKTPIYSTIIDGEAYYLKESYALNDDIIIESVMVSEGKLEVEIITDLRLAELKDINIISNNNPTTVYYPGGYSEEENKYFFSFMNETEQNYNITPFRDFKMIIAGKSYNISLEKAKSFNVDRKIYISNFEPKSLLGVNIGAKIIEGNDKLNIQLIASFEDANLKLSKFGKPKETSISQSLENLGVKGIISSSSNLQTDDLWVFDETGNKYKLEIPKDSKGRPVTIFETDAPKHKELTIKLPAIIASYHEIIESFPLSIPGEGEVTLNKEIDFTIQKSMIKSIKRLSPTSAEVEFLLNTGTNSEVSIRAFSIYSPDIKKIFTEFNDDKAIMTLEFDEKLITTSIEISYPNFVIHGDWIINIK